MNLNWINQNPTIATFLVVGLCLLVGYLEHKILGRVDIACLTWLFGLIVGSIAVVGSLASTTGWIIALSFFAVGILLIVKYYKRQKFRGP